MNNIKHARYRAPTPVYKSGGHPWSNDPRASFKNWLSNSEGANGSGFGLGTVKVYAAMWSTFVHFMENRLGRSAVMANAADIANFLDNAAVCRREQGRRRYELLLDRAFRAMSEDGPVHWIPSPIAPRQHPKITDKPMPFLTSQERAKVFAVLAEPSDFSDGEGWMRARAKALCALMLGAGFKPGQANHISVNCVVDGPLRFVLAPALGTMSEHRALVAPEAWPAIQSWLDARSCGDGPMFPGRGGAAAGAVGYARAFLGAKELLRGLGPLAGGERTSPQTLRNSYGATLIENGHGLESVREYMGFSRLEFARRFAEGHAAWVARMNTAGNTGEVDQKDTE